MRSLAIGDDLNGADLQLMMFNKVNADGNDTLNFADFLLLMTRNSQEEVVDVAIEVFDRAFFVFVLCIICVPPSLNGLIH